MVKFIFLSFIFHLMLLVFFKLELIDLKKNKEQRINVGLSQEQDNPKRIVTKEIKKDNPKRIVTKEIKKDNSKKIVTKEIKKDNPKKIVKKEIKKDNPKKIVTKEINNDKSNKKPEEKKFNDMLKDLAKEKLDIESSDNFDKTLKKLSNKSLFNNNKKLPNKTELSIIEKLILVQINESWSRPPGIKISKDLVIKMIVGLDINGFVINLKIHKSTQNEIKKNSALQPYLDSALRAIKKASPFEGLRKDRYIIWKEIIINFKPIETR